MLGLGNILTKGGALLGFPNKYSFNFDGSNDELIIPHNSEFNFGASTDFSFSFWLLATDVTQPDTFIVRKKSGTEGIRIFLTGSDSVFFNFFDGSTEKNVISASNSLTDNTFHHCCLSVDRDGNAQWYIDGNTSGSAVDVSSVGDINNTENLFIGSQNGSAYFDGLIDEFAIWNVALSASDVAKIASKPVDFSKASTYATDRTSNLKLWLRAGDKVLPEEDTSIARSDFYTDFDGSDDYVSIADSDDLSFGDGSADSPFSISAWINMDDATGFTIASKGVFNSTGEWLFNTSSADKLYFAIMDESVTSAIEECLSSSAITSDEGSWIHVVATYDGRGGSTARNGIKLYKNGSELSISASGGAGTYVAMENLGSDVYSGRYSSSYSNGAISNLSIYQTELDAQTIKQFAKSRYTPMRDTRFSVVDFDGSDDKIAFTRQVFTGAFTISWWFNGDTETFYQKMFDDSVGNNNILIKDSNGYVTIRINTHYKAIISGVPHNEWCHLAFTRDGSGNIKSYLNGVAKGTSSSTDEFALDFIGEQCVMSMASASMYNVEKSADEIYAIYQQGITYDESSLSGLVGYWRMGDDTSKAYPTIADSSSNSNDGTITNGASDDIVQQMVAGYDMGAFESSSEELGAERVLEPSFASSTGWATDYFGTGWSITGNKLVSDGSQSAGSNASADIDTSSGFYKVVITVDSISSGTIRPNLENWGSYISTSGTHTQFFTLTGNNDLTIQASADFVGSISFVSTKEVLQSDLSDTYPAIIDVNEPVLGAELVTSITNSSSNPWETFSGASGNTLALAINSDGTSGEMYSPEFGMSGGEIIKVTITITVNSGAILLRFSGTDGTHTSGDLNETINSSGTHTFYAIISGSDRDSLWIKATGADNISNITLSGKKVFGNVGTMQNQATSDLVYSSVLPDQSFLTGVNSAYNFIDLDGSDEYIDCGTGIGNFLGDDYAGDFSASVWFNADVNDKGIFNAGTSFGNDHGEFSIVASGNFIIYLNDAGYYKTFSAPSTGTWHHIAVSFDSSSESNLKVFLNGSQVTYNGSGGSFPSSGNLDFNNTKVIIGGYYSTSNIFNGKIGQTAFYNKALSETELSAIYTLGRHGNLLDSYSDNLLGYWAMSSLDSVTGLSDSISTIYDRSGNSNHGNPQNADAGDLASSPNAEPNGYAKGDTNRSTTTP